MFDVGPKLPFVCPFYKNFNSFLKTVFICKIFDMAVYLRIISKKIQLSLILSSPVHM